MIEGKYVVQVSTGDPQMDSIAETMQSASTWGISIGVGIMAFAMITSLVAWIVWNRN